MQYEMYSSLGIRVQEIALWRSSISYDEVRRPRAQASRNHDLGEGIPGLDFQ